MQFTHWRNNFITQNDLSYLLKVLETLLARQLSPQEGCVYPRQSCLHQRWTCEPFLESDNKGLQVFILPWVLILKPSPPGFRWCHNLPKLPSTLLPDGAQWKLASPLRFQLAFSNPSQPVWILILFIFPSGQTPPLKDISLVDNWFCTHVHTSWFCDCAGDANSAAYPFMVP